MRLYTILTEKAIPTESSHAIHEGKIKQMNASAFWVKGLEFTGELSFTNGLRVNGVIKGKVRSEATLEIGPGGKVDAEVQFEES